jgi:VanZ family protein
MFAGVDEWHQQFFVRDPSIADWIADVLGASAGTLVALRVRPVETA